MVGGLADGTTCLPVPPSLLSEYHNGQELLGFKSHEVLNVCTSQIDNHFSNCWGKTTQSILPPPGMVLMGGLRYREIQQLLAGISSY